MKVIKNINNNVSICLDSHNHELIAIGKGIGFKKPPYDIDLKVITRTYYDIDPLYINMINDIPEMILNISDQIICYARNKINNPISDNIVLTLADHIHFSIKRYEEKIYMKLPIVNDIQYLFETEMEIGNYGLRLIKKELNVHLPREEAAYIALHIINAEKINHKQEPLDKDIIDDITKIIEEDFQLKIDKNGFNYSRFVTHMHYLFKRSKQNEMIQSDNNQLYETLIQTYTKTYQCLEKIKDYLEKRCHWKLSDEECIYLILHINRLCAREDCDH